MTNLILPGDPTPVQYKQQIAGLQDELDQTQDSVNGLVITLVEVVHQLGPRRAGKQWRRGEAMTNIRPFWRTRNGRLSCVTEWQERIEGVTRDIKKLLTIWITNKDTNMFRSKRLKRIEDRLQDIECQNFDAKNESKCYARLNLKGRVNNLEYLLKKRDFALLEFSEANQAIREDLDKHKKRLEHLESNLSLLNGDISILLDVTRTISAVEGDDKSWIPNCDLLIALLDHLNLMAHKKPDRVVLVEKTPKKTQPKRSRKK